jgi:hypothetical protein
MDMLDNAVRTSHSGEHSDAVSYRAILAHLAHLVEQLDACTDDAPPMSGVLWTARFRHHICVIMLHKHRVRMFKLIRTRVLELHACIERAINAHTNAVKNAGAETIHVPWEATRKRKAVDSKTHTPAQRKISRSSQMTIEALYSKIV